MFGAGGFDGDIRIDGATGNVGIGRPPAANRLEVQGGASKTTAGDWLANSDRRIKKDIETVSDALETLDKVRLVSFVYREQYQAEHPSIEDHRYLNVIAQEFAEVFPDYVKSSGEKLADSDEEILQVDPYPLTIYSAAAIQELHEIVKEQQTRIAALEEAIAQTDSSGVASMFGAATPALAAVCLIGFLGLARRRRGGAR